MLGDKHRIRFGKVGDLRFLSHLDLLRCWERMLRRAAIPFQSSAGFHPAPRLVFALALPLGVIGHNEAADLELTELVDPSDLCRRLRAQAPAGLLIHSIERIPLRSSLIARRAIYRFPITPEQRSGLASRCRELLASPALLVERTQPRPRTLDIRPYLDELVVEDNALRLVVQVTPTGSARADEVLRLLGLGDELDHGAVLERLTLELNEVSYPSVDSGSPADRATACHWEFSPSGSLAEPTRSEPHVEHPPSNHQESS